MDLREIKHKVIIWVQLAGCNIQWVALVNVMDAGTNDREANLRALGYVSQFTHPSQLLRVSALTVPSSGIRCFHLVLDTYKMVRCNLIYAAFHTTRTYCVFLSNSCVRCTD
jgi:hypothetical protein